MLKSKRSDGIFVSVTWKIITPECVWEAIELAGGYKLKWLIEKIGVEKKTEYSHSVQ